MEPENEINFCKFYIKKRCKHGLGGSNCNYPHPAPCKKIYFKPLNVDVEQNANIFYGIRKVIECEMHNVKVLQGVNSQKIPTRILCTFTPVYKHVSQPQLPCTFNLRKQTSQNHPLFNNHYLLSPLLISTHIPIT